MSFTSPPANLHNSPPTVIFSHDQVGTLTIDTGIDHGGWGYNLNTATFPTYGGEVVQILSVYIDNLKLGGTCATYLQIEEIYHFFAQYMSIATQGSNDTVNLGSDLISGSSYNLKPVKFFYPRRNWHFLVYPIRAPGFKLSSETVTPQWQLEAFVIDNTPDLELIKNGITAAILSGNLPFNPESPNQGTFSLMGEISPKYGNPDTDPWETYPAPDLQQGEAILSKYSDYYNSLIPAYANGDFSSIYGAIGSQPSSPNSTQPSGTTPTVTQPGSTQSGPTLGGHPTGGVPTTGLGNR